MNSVKVPKIQKLVFTLLCSSRGWLSTIALVACSLLSTTPAAAAYYPTEAFLPSVSSHSARNEGISTTLSENWAGYVADTGSNYTSVTGTWQVPNIATSDSAAADATWVGIGGMSGSDLIQAGTQAITQNGTVQYQAWYETLPNASTDVSLTVNPGDSVTSSINEIAPNMWLIQITDNTTGQNFSTTLNYQSSMSSAEWIQEMPTVQAGAQLDYLPLDQFGSLTFTNAAATVNGSTATLSQANAQALTLVSSGYRDTILAYPSPISSDGESFTVTRNNGSTTASSRIPQLVPLDQSDAIPSADDDSTYQMHQLLQQLQAMLTAQTSSLDAGVPTQTQTYRDGNYTITVSTYSN